ncbi:DUF397 domain-containing protein [Streptomyces sp. GXMU-J15]|uniref:DUF397 domain-containing protein n=1 Tax=Streptomyces fuscus TaxID=3048495 RepID=A0ABT7J202_9ACTN|nr:MULTISPECIES: DUF397 domain-containing protein [Streptomyces]MDL2078885.1 DUF397 domain-containing protein [Streptomyces fuscus]SBT93525.1 protein of unknown function [Streptomyces sp. DI166]
MLTPDTWTKSSFSGGGQGDACVELARLGTRVAIRDSKDRARAPLSLPADVFTAFISGLKTDAREPRA